MSSSEADMIDNTVEGAIEDDLFGDEDQSDAPKKVRELSDRELDSGDDEDREDRAHPKDTEEVDDDGRTAQILDATVWRHPLPKPADGEFNLLRLPKFLGIDPLPYDPAKFELPTTDHHSDSKSGNFSASTTANSTIRFRSNVSGDLESNSVVYKWSDGSTTISVGDQHYVLQTKPLAPPPDSKAYQEVQDSHSYVASPSIASQLLVMVGHMTNQHTVRPNKELEDDALDKLQRGLAAATRGGLKGEVKDGPALIMNTQDPELQKRRAEIAEKERTRAQRRRETAAEKASLGSSRRPGIGGLNVDDLEGRGGRRAPAPGRKAPGAKRTRRRAEYDTDDDDVPRGRTREDEYDKEDDFLADSDEELEEGDEGEEEEEEEDALDDVSDKDQPKAKKPKTAPRPDESSDLDAEGDLDDDPAPAAGIEPASGRGRKGRNIIEDDDDE